MSKIFSSNISLVAILVIIGFAVYGNSLGNSFVWDDELLVTGNLSIRSLSNIPDLFSTDLAPEVGGNFFRPLQAISYTIDYACWELNPFGYHLTGILIHLANSILVFYLLLALIKRPAVPFFTALLFLVHPVQTESVAYIAGRADLLAALFILLAVIFSLDGRKIFRLFISMVFFLLALSAKEAAIILPLLIIVSQIMRRKISGPADNDKLSPSGWYYAILILVALIYAAVRYVIIRAGAASVSSNPYSFYERFLTGLEVILLYLKVFIFPIHLRMERVVFPVTALFSPVVMIASVILSGIAIGAVRAYRRSPIIFFGIAWFFVALLPYMNWFPLNAEMAEHWLYLPSIGFLLLFGLFSEKIIIRDVAAQPSRFGLFLLAAVIVSLSALTIRRNLDWRENKTIYLATARYSPESPRAHYNLGNIYLSEGQLNDAVREFTESIRIKDWDPKSHSNMGKALLGLNRIPEAVREFEVTVVLEPESPTGLIKLGAVYGIAGRLDESIRVLLKAIALDPGQPDAYNNLGSVYTRLERYDEAERTYRVALRLNPRMVEAIFNLGVVYYYQGRFNEAEKRMEKALQLDPNFTRAQIWRKKIDIKKNGI